MNVCEECKYYHDNCDAKFICRLDLEKIRADVIEELKTELIDIILGNEEFIDWQKQEIILCLECAIENLKEQER